MKGQIVLDNEDVKQAVLNFARRAPNHGIPDEVGKENVTLRLEYSGTFEDREAFTDGALISWDVPEPLAE